MSRVGKTLIASLLFIAYISFFAAIYTLIPDQFIFSTAHKEPSYVLTTKESSQLVSRLIAGEIERYPSRSPLGYLTGSKQVIEELLNSSPTQHTAFPGRFDTDFMTVRQEKAEILYIFGNGATIVGGCSVKKSVLPPSEYSPEQGKTHHYEGACNVQMLTGSEESAALVFSSPIDTAVFDNVLNPELGLQEGLFFRFLYFSTVTATTLGYGEIVPLTDTARALTSLQSVFGLILMGILIYWTTSTRGKENGSRKR